MMEFSIVPAGAKFLNFARRGGSFSGPGGLNANFINGGCLNGRQGLPWNKIAFG